MALPLSLLASAALSAGRPVGVALAVEEIDALRLDFGHVAILPLLVLPLAGLEAAFHENEAAFGQILGAVFRRLLEHDDAVPFRAVHAVAVAVGVGFVRGHVERADGRAGLGVFEFRVAPEPSDDHDFIEAAHGISSWERKPRSMVRAGQGLGGVFGVPFFEPPLAFPVGGMDGFAVRVVFRDVQALRRLL